MVMVERALEGSAARKFRAVLPDFGLNGEKAVTTEVMYLVIMMAVGLWRERGGRESEVVEVMKWDGMGWIGMDWRRRRAEEPRQLQVRHLMRVHTSLNNNPLGGTAFGHLLPVPPLNTKTTHFSRGASTLSLKARPSRGQNRSTDWPYHLPQWDISTSTPLSSDQASFSWKPILAVCQSSREVG